MYCENTNCRRTGLSKSEVEKDERSGRILCLGCYSLANPGWTPKTITDLVGEQSQVPMPVPRFGYAVSFDSFRGFSAQVSYGDVGLELVVPQRALRQFLGV